MGALIRSGRKPVLPATPEQVAGHGQQYLTFMVAGEMFVLAIKQTIVVSRRNACSAI